MAKQARIVSNAAKYLSELMGVPVEPVHLLIDLSTSRIPQVRFKVPLKFSRRVDLFAHLENCMPRPGVVTGSEKGFTTTWKFGPGKTRRLRILDRANGTIEVSIWQL